MADPGEDEAAQSIESLKAGGLPLKAQRRLAEARQSKDRFFTSTLKVPEGLIARAAGYQPISQVMGSSFYHVGYLGYQWSGGGEVTAMTHALAEVRRLAFSRMEQEATALGAHVVADVQVSARGYEWSGETLEFSVTGTAMTLPGEPPPKRPALTYLDADQLWKARLAGFAPLGIALGNVVWRYAHCDCMADGSWSNQPLPQHNATAAEVEALVVKRFRMSASELGADGVVGVRLFRKAHDHHHEGHSHFHLEMILGGTAVQRVAPLAATHKTHFVIDLRDRKPPAVPGEAPGKE
jgi:uncharacterized protein YbjQ (UPF0145 family)